MQELNTEGGLDNLTALTDKTATLGIVSADLYQYLERTDVAVGRLRTVAALNSNMVHIFTSKAGYAAEPSCRGSIIGGRCIGLKGDPVIKYVTASTDLSGLNVGLVGSAKITGRVFVMKSVRFNPVDFDTDAQAQAALKAGTIQAYITMSAWPNPDAQNPANANLLRLAAWVGKGEGVYSVATKNYKVLGQFGVPMITVPNLLMVRPIDPASDAGKAVTALQSCLASKLSVLQSEDNYLPSWADVQSTRVPDDMPAWRGTGNK